MDHKFNHNLVLVVDDEKDFRNIFAELVDRMGYPAITAEDGQSALEKIRKSTIRAAIIDYNMPGMNGIKLLEEIKKIDNTIFVVLISGYGNEEIASEAKQVGVDEFLVKPVDIDKLQDTLHKVLD